MGDIAFLTAACAQGGRKTTKSCFLTRELDLLKAQAGKNVSICIRILNIGKPTKMQLSKLSEENKMKELRFLAKNLDFVLDVFQLVLLLGIEHLEIHSGYW